MEPKTLDLRGLRCPEPLKRTQEELDLIKEGVLVVLVESPSNWNIERLAKKSGLRFEQKKQDNHWELRIVKTPHSRPPKEGVLKRMLNAFRHKPKAEGLGDMAIVVSRDTFGKEGDLGKLLIKAFLETMKVTDDIPAFMFFMNSGVMLTTELDETVSLLKEFESKGAEIYTCSTCLKHFGLEDRLRVGQAGGMAVLMDGMRTARRVITI